VGPVRHRQLIRLLAFVVAFDLTAGVAVLYARGGPASAASTDTAPGGILAGGQFNNRRGSGRKPSADPIPEVAKAPDASAGPTPTSTVTTSAQATDPALAPGTNGTNGTDGASGTNGANGTPDTNGTNGAPGTNGANGTPDTKGANGAPGTNASVSQTTAAFTDRTGDTVVDGTGEVRAERAADLVQSHVVFSQKAVVFAVQTDQSADPRQNPHWASESTFISWELDTDGDAVPDYEVQYSLSEGSPIAGISRLGDTDAASVCEAEAGYLTEGYAVGFDPACIGGPAAFSYRVTIFYDTDPANEDADVISDVAPDGGQFRPVARPGG
jgi:Collagen triple helix repeat (20 copies)